MGQPHALFKRLKIGFWLAAGLTLLLLTACSQPDSDGQPTAAAGGVIIPTVAELPTLFPTDTPRTRATPTVTPPLPTPLPSATPINFDEPVIQFRYRIPAVGLDRRLDGSVGATITLFDEATQGGLALRNRPGVMLELQSALEGLVLEPVPEGCDRCVAFEYSLPAIGESGSGWLQDPILLASVENFFGVWLGAHFPEGTAVGLRRSASAYSPAHTLAILDDGTTWLWTATAAEIPPPSAASLPTNAIESIPFNRLEAEYSADCLGYPTEQLRVSPDGSDPLTLDLKCPELALPTTLLPLYTTLDAQTNEIFLSGGNAPYPRRPFPLDGLLYFQREDGAFLLVRTDGSRVAFDALGNELTDSVALAELDGLIDGLLASGTLPRGVGVITNPERTNDSLLLVRGELGVYELGWSDRIGQTLVPEIGLLDDELFRLVGPLVQLTPTPQSTPPLTGTITITPTVTVTPTE